MSSTVNGNDQAEAAQGRTLSEVEAELSRAVAEVAALRVERDAASAAIKAATEAQETWRLEELEDKVRGVRRQIDEGHARLCGLYAERARLQLPEAESSAVAARREYERAHAEYLEAHARVNRLGVEADNARVRAMSLRRTAEENEQKAQAVSRVLARQS